MSQALQLGLERRRQLAGKVQVLARHRVIEPQGGGVEQQAMGRQKPAAGARVIAQIHSFSHQRVPLFGQVDANLMGAPGFKTHAAQGRCH